MLLLLIAIRILVVSLNIMVKKCVVGCHSVYHKETTFPAFPPANHEGHKNKKISFVKNRQPSLILFLA